MDQRRLSMYKFYRILACFIALSIFAVDVSAAFTWGRDKSLVTINETKYYPEDFNHWWKNWKEKETPFPDDLREFVDWQLLVQEAEYMELYREPAFRRKIETFLKVRGLMMLKAEEIDAKIHIDDSQLKALFEEKYAPKWIISAVGYTDEEKAADILAELKKTGKTIEEFLAESGAAEDKPVKYDKAVTFYPSSMPEGWRPVLQPLQKGDYAGPLLYQDNYLVVYVVERKDFDEQDFKDARAFLFRKLRKAQEARLSNELAKKLKEKFHVQIDDALLDELDLREPQEGLLDKVLIATDKVNFTVRMFVGLAARNAARQADKELSKEEWRKKKLAYIADLLFQNLTAWEALDRHYEENNPAIKEVYRFYRQHRLIRELERRIFRPGTEPSDEEVKKYYQDNIALYSHSGSARLGLLMGDLEMINKVWEEVSRGEDFVTVTKKIFAIEPEVKDIKYTQFGEELKKAVAPLAEGEISPPFTVKDRSAMVKLIKRNMGEPEPLSKVRSNIASQLRQKKFNDNRAYYLQQLRERSEIKVNEKVWKKLKSEFGAKNDE